MTIRDAVAAVRSTADDIRLWQEDLYRDLHQHPELSHQEHRTAATVAERLRAAGFDVTTGVGGTGVVGVLRNGEGPSVLLRADMDALPVREQTGLPYASTVVATPVNEDTEVPVMHACGHDMHTACLLGAAQLMASGVQHWRGKLVTVFQPAEETIDGARGMVEDGLADLVGPVDVALGQHVSPLPAGILATIAGPSFAGGASIRITVYGRGGHASMPQSTVDPAVLASAIVLRLQGIVAREIQPGEPAVVTVGALRVGSKANIIADEAELLVNIRFYSDAVRETLLAAIRRIVAGECAASGSPREPVIEVFEQAPVTDNDVEVTARVNAALSEVFGAEALITPPLITGSEDFSDIAHGVQAPYSFWLFGGTDPTLFASVLASGGLTDLPANHSPHFAPSIQPTLDTGTTALVAAALSWLAC